MPLDDGRQSLTGHARQMPMSKNALKHLGERLADGATDAADDEALNDFLLSRQVVLETVQAVVRGAGYESTSRVKGRDTLIDKLRRSRSFTLATIQDVAGMRLLVHNRTRQDEAVARICAALEVSGHSSRPKDRRIEPSYGYRAVHIVTDADGLPIEIQVRTNLQDSWAQLTERIADVLGRGIRYGEDPLPTGDPGEDERRRQWVAGHAELSEKISELETRYAVMMRLRAELAGYQHRLDTRQHRPDVPQEDLDRTAQTIAERDKEFKRNLVDLASLARTIEADLQRGVKILDGGGQLL